MDIVGTVAAEEVPGNARRVTLGLWTGLAQKCLEAQQAGRVLVVKVADMDEYRRMRNGIIAYLHRADYTLDASIVQEQDGLRVFLQLIPVQRRKQPDNGSVVVGPIGRRRKVSNA